MDLLVYSSQVGLGAFDANLGVELSKHLRKLQQLQYICQVRLHLG
jgi:hypothetical protein